MDLLGSALILQPPGAEEKQLSPLTLEHGTKLGTTQLLSCAPAPARRVRSSQLIVLGVCGESESRGESLSLLPFHAFGIDFLCSSQRENKTRLGLFTFTFKKPPLRPSLSDFLKSAVFCCAEMCGFLFCFFKVGHRCHKGSGNGFCSEQELTEPQPWRATPEMDAVKVTDAGLSGKVAQTDEASAPDQSNVSRQKTTQAARLKAVS